MPGINKYEGKIPYFYRRRTLEVLMFGHVTALREANDMKVNDAIKHFMKTYGIDEEEYSIENALVIYHRVKNNFIWSNIKKNL